jgi:hypothetical protein
MLCAQVKAHMTQLGIFEHPIGIWVSLRSLVKLFHGDGSKGLRKRASLWKESERAKNAAQLDRTRPDPPGLPLVLPNGEPPVR